MKCVYCGCEMLVDRINEKQQENKAEIIYKCPNKVCANYGYGNMPASENNR